MAASLKSRHLFGPVHSRRLGQSLGVDLVTHKSCNLDCRYCECGPTTRFVSERRFFYPKKELLDELTVFFSEQHGPLDHVTFSGSGEPTLSLALAETIDAIHRLTPTPVALLTNGLLLHREDVIHDIQDIDLLIPSLDAANIEVFERLNRPAAGSDFELYLQGLRDLKSRFQGKVFIEILLCKDINDSHEHLLQLADEIRRISPDGIQINTLFRPGSDRAMRPLSESEMAEASNILGFIPIQITRPTNSSSPINTTISPQQLRQAIMKTISRRPCTLRDLSDGLDVSLTSVKSIISDLLDEDRIQEIDHPTGVYYQGIPDV